MKGKNKPFTRLLATTFAASMVAFAASCTQEVVSESDSAEDSVSTSESVQTVRFTVSFDTAGGSEVDSVTVDEGGTVAAPGAPEKDGYIFIGWYADAGHKTAFDFDAPVTADTTVYAYFVEQVEAEFTATLYDTEGEVTGTVSTVGGKLFDLPTKIGGEDVAWYVSDYGDKDKLTYIYDGRTLSQNEDLFAVAGGIALNVTANGISWAALGANKSYTVTVTTPDGATNQFVTSANNYNYDFATAPAGDFVFTVSAEGNSYSVYYRNKVLPRVSLFDVSGGVLYFNPVAGATDYYITVLGGDDHTYTDVALGNVTAYDFSGIPMLENGLAFIVKATAEGYADSLSDTFVYTSKVPGPEEVYYSEEEGKVFWTAVDGAEYYIVTVNGKEYVAFDTNFSLNYYTGSVTVGIRAFVSGSWCEEAVSDYNFNRPVAPVIIGTVGNRVVWQGVENAASYDVRINDNAPVNTQNLTYELSGAGVTVYVRTVDKNGEASAWSDGMYISASMSALTYDKGRVSWSAVFGAKRYFYSVNGGDPIAVIDGLTYCVPDLTKDGNNVISVWYETDADTSDEVSVEVDAYAVTFDENGGSEVSDRFFAYGDLFRAGQTSRGGYTFGGWYTQPDGKGKKMTEISTLGGENKFYAYWKANEYTVTLDATGGTLDGDTTLTVAYDGEFTLPVPVYDGGSKVFGGWFIGTDSTSIMYADQFGEGKFAWNTVSDVTLYAVWLDVFKFNDINSGKAYSVSKGDDIELVTEVTVPVSHNGKPVTTIDTFANVTTLKVVNIPDTIKNVEYGTAFLNCISLSAVNVYETDDKDKGDYYSEDGVLFYNSEYDGGKNELVVFPRGKTGAYSVPAGTTHIMSNVFRASKLTEVSIPTSVVSIGAKAFYNSWSLRKVVFESDGVDENPLELGLNVFEACLKLEEISLPSRLSAFAVNTFTDCYALKTITVNGTNGNYSAKDGYLYDAEGETLVYAPFGISGAVTLPTGTIGVGDGAFGGCYKITSVTIPATVEYIGAGAFRGCSGITSVTFKGKADDNALTVAEDAFSSCSVLTAITLPANLKKTGANAFNSYALTVVDVQCGDGLDFAAKTFGYATDVTFGENVGMMDIKSVFGNSITSIVINPNNPNYSVRDGVIYDKQITRIVYYPTYKTGEFVIPETVTEIGSGVFNGNTSLTAITIGKNVTSIGASAFANCSGLKTVTFAGGREENLTIGASAFSGTAVGEVDLPETVTELGNNAFQNAKSLTSVSIPASLVRMGAYDGDGALTALGVFSGCTALKSITVAEGNTAFAAKDGTLYTKSGDSLSEIILAYNVSGDVVVPSTVSKIWRRAYYQNKKITSVTFEGDEGEIEFGASVFAETTVSQITFSPRVKVLGKAMFEKCTSLTSVYIPKTVTVIGNRAFRKCTALATLTFEDDRTEELVIDDGNRNSMGEDMFYADMGGGSNSSKEGAFIGCGALKTVVLPEKTVKIGSYAFAVDTEASDPFGFGGFGGIGGIGGGSEKTDTGVVSITLPTTLKEIGVGAFLGEDGGGMFSMPGDPKTAINSGLTTVTINKREDGTCDLYKIGDSAFALSNITSFEVPKSVTEFGTGVFSDTLSMTSASFEAGMPITVIPTNTFNNAKKLTSFDVPATIKTISESAFANCAALAQITFAGGEDNVVDLEEIATKAFEKSGLTSFTFPASANEYVVRASIFNGATKLKTVVLSDSVKDIADVFLGCKSIETISVPETSAKYATKFDANDENSFVYNKTEAGVTTVRLAYKAITGEVVIPTGITEISANAFNGQTGVTKVTIPSTVTTIGNSAFSGCTNLAEIDFGENSNLANIGTGVFNNCKALTAVELPDGVKTITSSLFNGCTALASVAFAGDVEYIGDSAFNGTAITSITVPGTAQYIGSNAFKGCTKLSQVTIGDGVKTINASAFEGCTALAGIDLPSSIEIINVKAFNGCSALTEIVLPKDVILGNPSLQENYSTNSNVFYNCTSLTKVTFVGNVNSLGAYIFYGCTKLTTLEFWKDGVKQKDNVIPEETRLIGSSAFYNSGITDVTILNGNMKYGTNIFQNCKSLVSATLPEGMESVPNNAFSGCSSLENVNYIDSEGVVYANALPTTLLTLGSSAFANCAALTSLSVSDGITAINATTFDGCSLLSGFVIPETVVSIGANAFRNNLGLTSIVIPENVKTITGSAFTGCNNLAEIIIDQRNLNFISDSNGIMYDATGKNVVLIPIGLGGEIIIPDGVTTIKANAFANHPYITKVVFADTVETIEAEAFKDCTGITSVTFNSGLKKISERAFSGCTALAKADIPDTVMEIGEEAFANTAIKNVYIPASVTTLYSNVYKGCTIDEFVIGDGIETFSYSFSGCYVARIIIPASVKTIYSNQFRGWTSEQYICFEGGEEQTENFSEFWYNDCEATVVYNYKAE